MKLSFRKAAALFLAALPLSWGFFPAFSLRAAQEDAFPAGISEGEKAQLLDGIYGESGEDADVQMPTEEELNASVYENLTDEEARELIRSRLPSEEELARLAENYSDRVMPLAAFKAGYDAARSLYSYELPGGGKILISAPLGGWTNYAVALIPEGNVKLSSVVRDGEVLTDTADEEGAYFFRETGCYSFIAGNGSEAESLSYISGSFRIVDVRSALTASFLWAPEGYVLSGAAVDGKAVAIRDERYLDLPEDGVYDVRFRAKAAGGGLPEELGVSFSRDTQAPYLDLEGEISGGYFVGKVQLSSPEPDARVQIWFNGQPAVSPTGELAAEGSYYITASDPTGNWRAYNFVIERRGHIPWGLAAAAGAVLLVLAIFVVATAGRGMRRIR